MIFYGGKPAGTQHRNHCPNCLTSLHLDNEPGDRAADCGGQMEPVAVWVRKGGEWAIIHRCRLCGKLTSNRIAADDRESAAARRQCSPMSRAGSHCPVAVVDGRRLIMSPSEPPEVEQLLVCLAPAEGTRGVYRLDPRALSTIPQIND